jgi:pimeloyl-ACP methyl ester carboxylesterase
MHSKINGLSVHCSGDSKNPAIVFLHGFPFDSGIWNKQVDALQADYFCITYDIRGLGSSEPGDGQYTIELFVDDLIDVLNSLNVYTAALCTLSMGGYIALRALEREYIRFNKLILCDTRADTDDNNGKIKRATACKKIAAGGTAKYVADFLPNCVAEKFLNNAVAEYNEMVTRFSNANPTGLKGCQIAMMGRNDLTGFLPRIEIPTLVLCGEYDTFSPPALMQNMAAKIPGSSFYIVPEAGHMAPLENPGFVNPLIAGFLS